MNTTFWRELILLLFLFLVTNLIWSTSDPGFTQARPHPYLIVILVVAARHGVAASLVACTLAVGQLLLLSQTGHNPLSLASFLSRPWNFVLATWIVLGASVGAASDSKQKEQEALQERYDFLDHEFSESKRRLDILEVENNELRKKVFGENETLNTVYAMARQLMSLTGKELFEASLDLVEKFVGATHCSIYLLDKKRLNFELAETRGTGSPSIPKVVPRGEALFEKSLKQRKPVSAKELFSAEKERQSVPSILVSHLGNLDRDESPECGVLVIHQIPLEKLNSETIGVFGLLSDWISRSLNLVQKLEAAEGQNVELLTEIQKRRFTTAFIQTLSHVSPLEPLALKVLCSEDSSEIAYWNASRMLGIATESSNFSNEAATLEALTLLLENGSRLGAIKSSLPTQPTSPGCTGLRLRIAERTKLNSQAVLRVLRFYISRFQAKLVPALYTINKEKSPEARRPLVEQFLQQSEFLAEHKQSLLMAWELNSADVLRVTKSDLLLSLGFDADPWTRRLAALAAHEMEIGIDPVVLDALVHSDHELDQEVGNYLSAIPTNS